MESHPLPFVVLWALGGAAAAAAAWGCLFGGLRALGMPWGHCSTLVSCLHSTLATWATAAALLAQQQFASATTLDLQVSLGYFAYDLVRLWRFPSQYDKTARLHHALSIVALLYASMAPALLPASRAVLLVTEASSIFFNVRAHLLERGWGRVCASPAQQRVLLAVELTFALIYLALRGLAMTLWLLKNAGLLAALVHEGTLLSLQAAAAAATVALWLLSLYNCRIILQRAWAKFDPQPKVCWA